MDRKPGNGLGSYATLGEFQSLLRAGDLLIPKIQFTEPLQAERHACVGAIRTGKPPLADGRNGLAVVEVPEAAVWAIKVAQFLQDVNAGIHRLWQKYQKRRFHHYQQN